LEKEGECHRIAFRDSDFTQLRFGLLKSAPKHRKPEKYKSLADIMSPRMATVYVVG
jgi:hypothetical protein